MKTKHLLFAVYSIVIALLLASVIHSGYRYQFDPDELFHINVVFLLRHGLVPYRDFFITYTPFFQWFLTPLSYLTGFTFHLLEAARITMIVLFIIRLLFIFLITRKIFGSIVAYVFVPLYLFDPFTVFSGMQIRPDNLMMTLYLAGIFFLLLWYFNKRPYALPLAGLLLGASVVALVKNIPATAFIALFTVIELKKNRNYRQMIAFISMMIVPVACFVVWASLKGIFPSMMQQVVFDAKQLNDSLKYPQNILNYYWPPNVLLYGFPDRPITWAYELCLPLVAFAGMYTTGLNLNTFGAKHRLIAWFTAACLLQWVSLFFVRSVFLQYFLPVSWFLSLFAAFAIAYVYETIFMNKTYKYSTLIIGLVFLIGGLVVCWKANTNRASASYDAQAAYLENQWRIIPNTATVFPGSVFRLSIYPLGFKTNFVDLSKNLLVRYGSPSVYLKRYKVPYVVLDPYNFSFLDAQTQDYIRAHYQQNLKDQNMWTLRS